MPTFTGTPGDDTLVGTPDPDLLEGLGGNDTLTGEGGNDTTDGGPGNDSHFVENAGDIVIERAGEGDDEVITSVSYALGQGTWVETLRTDNAASAAALSLWGNEIANSIYGNAGNNILGGGGGNDYLVGLEGNDYLIGGGGNDVMTGGIGDDTYTIDLQVGDTVRYEGEQFPLSATILNVGDGDTVTVRIQRSSTVFETRNVSVSTLFGIDTILESSAQGNDVILAYMSYALAPESRVEVLVAADGTADIMLRGNFLNNSLYGNDGDNLLTGGGGDDYLFGGVGVDRLFGDTGDDTLVGGDGNDELRGGSGRDTLLGGSGDDLLDAISGGQGVMVGGTGNDTYIVSFGTQVVEAVGEGFDRIDLNTGTYTLPAGVSVEVIAAPANSFGSFTITGNELDQTIVAGEGNDRLAGGGGTDTLNGRGGNDIYDVYDGREIIVEAANQGNDTVFTSIDYTLNAGAQVETMSTVWQFGDQDLDLTGNEFGQRLVGNYGSNTLDGRGGNDLLIGLGAADTFSFTTALGSGNVDTIHDFQAGIDTIALDDAIFAGLTPGDLDSEAFATGTSATEADDRIIYDPNTGNLYYDADGSGSGTAVLFATLGGAPNLQATDFAVI
jgi:Ca2+-binding RTX toxin-like protein